MGSLQRSTAVPLLSLRPDVKEVMGFRGPRCALAGFARRIGAEYRPDPRSMSFLPYELRPVRHRLKGWLRPFNGVATKYLPNYLQWFRTSVASRTPSNPRDQQFPRTALDTEGERMSVDADSGRASGVRWSDSKYGRGPPCPLRL